MGKILIELKYYKQVKWTLKLSQDLWKLNLNTDLSLTIVSFGTSLPELVTTIISSKKGEQDILLGNIIGGNIFNICLVLGIPVLIFGNLVPSSFALLDMAMLVISAVILLIFGAVDRELSRTNGLIMLGFFLIYYFLIML